MGMFILFDGFAGYCMGIEVKVADAVVKLSEARRQE